MRPPAHSAHLAGAAPGEAGQQHGGPLVGAQNSVQFLLRLDLRDLPRGYARRRVGDAGGAGQALRRHRLVQVLHHRLQANHKVIEHNLP